jgi:hypothetical protein
MRLWPCFVFTLLHRIKLFNEKKMKVADSHFTSIAFAKDLYAKEPAEVFKSSLLANGLYFLETA